MLRTRGADTIIHDNGLGLAALRVYRTLRIVFENFACARKHKHRRSAQSPLRARLGGRLKGRPALLCAGTIKQINHRRDGIDKPNSFLRSFEPLRYGVTIASQCYFHVFFFLLSESRPTASISCPPNFDFHPRLAEPKAGQLCAMLERLYRSESKLGQDCF